VPAKPIVVTAEVRVYATCAVYPHDLLRRAFDRRHQFRQKFVLESQERFYAFDGFDDEVPGSQSRCFVFPFP